MSSILLVLGIMLLATDISGSENVSRPNLKCVNDYEELMSCEFRPEAPRDCYKYNLTVQLDSDKQKMGKHCTFIPSERAIDSCTCFFKMEFTLEQIYTATLRTAGKQIEAEAISIKDTIKPKTPTITSVEKTENGNFQITWKNNYKTPPFSQYLSSVVIYQKKGDTQEVLRNTLFTFYEILARDLEPNTDYVVSVRSHYKYGEEDSDTSEEWEFKTPASFETLLLAIIIGLSIIAVFITAVIFVWVVRLKAKWWDSVTKTPNRTLDLIPGEQKLLQPFKTVISPIYVDLPKKDPNESKAWSKCYPTEITCGSGQQSNEVQTDSSSAGYEDTFNVDIIANVQNALRKAFPQLSTMSSLNKSSVTESNRDSSMTNKDPSDVRDDNPRGSSVSCSFDNKTYAILIPGCQNQNTSGNSETPAPTGVTCDLAYHLDEGLKSLRNTCPEPQVQFRLVTAQRDLDLTPVGVSSNMQTDFSYHAHDAESERLSSSSIVTSDHDPFEENINVKVGGTTDASTQETLNMCSKEAISDINPCYSPPPTTLCSLSPPEGDYQAFHSLVK